LVPDEQVWVEVGKLISGQIPDVNGKTLPVGAMTGTYELSVLADETDKLNEGLFEGKLVVDKTYGYAVHGCASCCPEYDNRYIVQDPLDLVVGGWSTQSAWGFDACTGNTDVLRSSNWQTGNPQIATSNNGSNPITAVAVGTTTDYASTQVMAPDSRGYCRWSNVRTTGTVNVGPVSCAIPTNFRQTTESNLPNGTLHFVYTWDSTTGITADLAGCTVGETVFYPGSQNPYVWPLPMVDQTRNPDPHQSTGNNNFSPDNNLPPSSYRQPYAYAHFPAIQRFWWICPCFQNGNLQTFVPDVTIDRKVFKDADGIWKYQIQKSGYTNKIALP